MRHPFLFPLLFLACIGPLSAQEPNLRGQSFKELANKQRTLITNYCRLDFEGARLTSDGWERIKDFAPTSDNPDFSTVYIVLRYQMQENPVATYDVSVNYMMVGKYEEAFGYTPLLGTKIVTFKTHTHHGQMQIADIDPNAPFVSRKAALEWLKGKLAGQQVAANRTQIEAAIKALETQPQTTAPVRP